VASRRGRRAPPATAEPEALRYIETSALLAALLDGDVAARKSLRARGTLVTSQLTFAEARRSLVRARHGGRLTAEQERSALRALSRLRTSSNSGSGLADYCGVDERDAEEARRAQTRCLG
jgi:hypothetical protein